MRNAKLELLGGLVGSWKLTLSDAWFMEPAGTRVHGTAEIEWFDDAFITSRTRFNGEVHSEDSETTLVFGCSDAEDAYRVLYWDDRGTCRVFAMEFDGSRWTMERKDPDFHQRFIADVEPDRILGRWEASDDQGRTWRKDFDLTFDRVATG